MAANPLDRRIRLIVNADDFGISPGANRAIVRAHREGILTSTSLMVGAEAADAAISMAREFPNLGVGLHLTLACGRCSSAPKSIAGLVDADGRFDDQPARAGLRYYLRRRWHPLIKQEMDAQFRAFAATGIPMDHLNGHLHFHLHPTVFGLIRRHWRHWNIRAVRLTRDSDQSPPGPGTVSVSFEPYVDLRLAVGARARDTENPADSTRGSDLWPFGKRSNDRAVPG